MNRLTVLLAALLMAACATPPKTASNPAPQPHDSAVSQAEHALTAAEIESKRLAAEQAEIEALQHKSVYFDFDRSSIRTEFQDTIRQQAEFIKSHANRSVTLEGNADERGSNEYNLALGEERASSVKKSLGALGVPEHQLVTRSLGDSKPRLSCHQEKCWQENRRVDFVYKR